MHLPKTIAACAIVTLALPAVAASLPDWSGQWQFAGSVKLIETTPQGVTLETDKRTRDHPPYKPAWEARYAAALPLALLQGSSAPNKLIDSYTRFCAAGAPRIMASPFTLEFALSPEQSWIIAYASEVRHIYTDPKFKLTTDNAVASPWGYSYGHWRGDTLVFDTTAITPGLWLDTTPIVLSAKASLHEEIRKTAPGRIEDSITITDPEAFTAPWKIHTSYSRVKNFTPAGEDTCKGQNSKP